MKNQKNFLLIVRILPLVAFAQTDKMETDLPSESLTPTAVSKNRFQVEVGFRKEHDNKEGKRSDEYLYPTAYLKYGLTQKLELRMQKLTVFAEVPGYTSKAQAAKNTFDAGLLYQLSPNLQLDIYGGGALSKNAPDSFIKAGISFRLPK